jgi:predicted anti-sigma-YlaC factor YlaD
MRAGVEHLSCRELVEVLTAYLEGALTPEQRADIERHLVFCHGCADYAGQMRRTTELLGRMAAGDPVERPDEDLLKLFRTWRAAQP